MTSAELLSDTDFDEIEATTLALIEASVEAAIAAPRPAMSTLEKDVYVRY